MLELPESPRLAWQFSSVRSPICALRKRRPYDLEKAVNRGRIAGMITVAVKQLRC